MTLSGTVVLVTGAAQGIGAAVAQAFGAEGAIVAAADANASGLSRQANVLCTMGHKVIAYTADVRDPVAVASLVDRVERDCGPVAVLVNAAGVLRTGPLLDCPDEDWNVVMGVNVTGVFNVSRAVGARMAARGTGTIVTVASNASGVPRMNMGAYAASKAATAMFTRCLGLELAGHGIRCNVVSPGSTDTPMLRGMWHGEDETQAVIDGTPSAYRTGIPLRKLATPEDIASAVLFLASDQASHITMQNLYVDGGAALQA